MYHQQLPGPLLPQQSIFVGGRESSSSHIIVLIDMPPLFHFFVNGGIFIKTKDKKKEDFWASLSKVPIAHPLISDVTKDQDYIRN